MARGPVTHCLWGAVTHGSTPTLREAVHIFKSVMTVAGAKKHDLFILLGRQGWKELSCETFFFCLCFGVSVSHL